METLGKEPAFDLSNRTGPRIYARNYAQPSTFMGATAVVSDSFVAEGCEVFGRVEHSVISVGVTVGEGAVICDSVIMPGVTVGNGAVIRHAIVGEGAKIGAGAVVGQTQTCAVQDMKIAVIGKDQAIQPGQVVEAGAVI